MKYLLSILLLCSVLIAVDDKTLIQENGTFVIVDKSLSVPVSDNSTSPIGVQCAGPDYGPAVDVKTLGLKGNGSDEKTLLGTILNRGGTFLFKDITVSIGGSVNISQAVNVKMVFDNAKIIMLSNATDRKSMFYAYPEVKHIEVEGGTFDGNGVALSGLYLNTSYYIHDAVIKNMTSRLGDNDAAIGIYSRFKNDSCAEIANNTIIDMYGKSNNQLTDGQGAARGIMLVWDSATRSSLHAYIHDNQIDHIYGEEGGGMFIYDHDASKKALTSKIEIKNNTISRCNRRMIKCHAGNTIIENNSFNTHIYGEEEAINSGPIVQVYAGADNVQINNNNFKNNGNHRQLISLQSVSNVEITGNSFYSRKNGAPVTFGQALEVRETSNNITFSNNTIDTDGLWPIVMPTNSLSTVNILSNNMTINQGNKTFVYLMQNTYNHLLFEDNVVDGTKGNATAGSFNAFVETTNTAYLNNARFIGNRIIPGPKQVNNGRFASFWNTNRQGSVLFQNNETEGSDQKFHFANSTNITY